MTDDASITQFFPTEASPIPTAPRREASIEEVDARFRELTSRILGAPIHHSTGIASDDSSSHKPVYEAARTAADLSGVAEAFYSAAGN